MSRPLEYPQVLACLTEFIKNEILQDPNEALDEAVPLLELGILDSLAMVNTIAFIEREFKVRIPQDWVLPRNFDNLRHLSEMVLSLRGKEQARAA